MDGSLNPRTKEKLFVSQFDCQVNMSISSMTTAWRRVARQQSGYNELFSPSIADTKTTILWYFRIFGSRTEPVAPWTPVMQHLPSSGKSPPPKIFPHDRKYFTHKTTVNTILLTSQKLFVIKV